MKESRDRPYSGVPPLPDDPRVPVDRLVTGGTGSIELEIGFGKGRFLLDRAQREPAVRFAGIETRRKWVHLAAERAAAREIGNVTVWHGDARGLLRRLTPDRCISRFFVNFPDPWWKARHQKRMVVTPDVIEQMVRLLAEDGEIFVQTDVDFRGGAYLERLQAAEKLEAVCGDGTMDANPFGARSAREIRCEELGLPIYRALFRRVP